MKELKIDRDKILEAAKGCPDVERVFKKLWPEEFEPEIHDEYGDVYESSDWYFMVGRIGDNKVAVSIKGGTPDCAGYVGSHQSPLPDAEFKAYLKGRNWRYIGHISKYLRIEGI